MTHEITPEQRRLMNDFAREIEIKVQCWNELGGTKEATKSYEKGKADSIKNYLTQIVNAG